MKYLYIVLFVLAADFGGLVLWVLSGQVPADGVYVGAISNAVIRLII